MSTAVVAREVGAPVIAARSCALRPVSTELKRRIAQGPVTVCDAAHLDGLAAGLKGGHVTIEGDSGDYLGVLNDGATICVTGNAGRYLADNMTHGTVIVEGNAGDAAAPYCYGGTVVVKGNAGDFTAVMNKGALIIIGGDVGDEVATYALAGDLVIAGNAGKNLGNYMIRGNIYIGGVWESLGHNTRLEEMTDTDRAKLQEYFAQYGIQADPARFRKIGRLSEKPFYK
ncbi:MAG: tributyrin esterase [Dehalococcoidia bacterium]|nr:tributyrin esterase [Dehalococcoidia bacterium]